MALREYGQDPQRDNPLLRGAMVAGAVGAGLFGLARFLRPRVTGALAKNLERDVEWSLSKVWTKASRQPQPGVVEAFRQFSKTEEFAPHPNAAYTLGYSFVNSKLMQAMEFGAKHLRPLHVFERLMGIDALRELYRARQIRYLGREGESLLFQTEKHREAIRKYSERVRDIRNDPLLSKKARAAEYFTAKQNYRKGLGKHLFYAYGDVYRATDAGTISKLPGRYFLAGQARASEMEGRTLLETSVRGLSGATVSPENLRGYALRLEASKANEAEKLLAKGQKPEDFPEVIKRWKDWDETIAHQRALADRIEHPAGIQKSLNALDIGLNQRGAYPWQKAYWQKRFETVGGFFNPQDVVGRRTLSRSHPYDIIQAFEFNWDGLRKMFFGGRGDPRFKFTGGGINTGTVLAFHLLNRINTGIAWSGFPFLALSGLSARTPAHFFASVLLKRALPLTAGAFYAGYLNDQTGFSDHLAEARAKADVMFSAFKERHGINHFMWATNYLSGGFWSYAAHPFLETPVGLSPDQLEEFQRNGQVPVRKGRWWAIGSGSPFRGERIQYFTPTYLQWARAGNIYQTSTLWGSKDEYYANAAFPTPTHPLAPLQHFVLDRYHYENKHYRDRPYPTTAPLFEPTSPWGAILNPTLGRIIKPQRTMHRDELPESVGGKLHRAQIASLNEAIKERADQMQYVGYVTPSGIINPMAVQSIPGAPYALSQVGRGHQAFAEVAADNEATKDEGDEEQATGGEAPEEGISTSGPRSVVAYGSGKRKSKEALRGINKGIVDASYRPRFKSHAQRFTGGALLEPARLPGSSDLQDPNDPHNLHRLVRPYDPRYQAGLGYYSLTEVAGIYGFSAASLVDYPLSTRPAIADAGRMTSFERTYWDRWNTGGMLPTPELSEAFRRFLPHRYHSNDLYNPIRNTMPRWLPGIYGEDPDYFLDFTTGDPYTKVPNGEARLPGAAYEKLHGIAPADLTMRGSQVGYDEGHMYEYLTGQREPFSGFMEEIMESGQHIHQIVQSRWKRQGILVGAEIPIEDRENNITGTMDAILKLQNGQRLVAEIKTLSDNRWKDIIDQHHLDQKHLEQLNFYMHQTGIHRGELVYVRRSDMQEETIPVTYDPALWKHTLGKIQHVRGQIRKEMSQGLWSPGDLYDDVTKLSILADVAPWSQQYRRYRDYLVHLDTAGLSPQDRARVQEIKRQVTARKKRFEMHPYVARDSDLVYENVHVDKVLAPGVFTTREHPDNPVKLAAVRVSTQDQEANEFLRRYIHPGSVLRVGVSADRSRLISHDTLHTIRAVAFSGHTNLNRELIDRGLGTETEEHTPAGLHVRFSEAEIHTAKKLEYLAHLPIPVLHNKFMPVNSPLELYKSSQVYGKDWQDWKHPFKDYLFPSLEAWAQQGLVGLAAAGLMGYFAAGSRNARFVLPLMAVASVAAVGAYRHNIQPIPEYRRHERDVNEYFDTLKYLKYEGLFERQREWIMKHQHHDIGALVERYRSDGDRRKRTIQILKQQKRRIIEHDEGESRHGEVVAINRQLRALRGFRQELRLTPEDVLALQYLGKAKSTLYGAQSSDIHSVLQALPPAEREFFQEFIDAPGRNRKEILKLVPRNERRFLESHWGMKVEPRPKLDEYFKSHYLPPMDWKGWGPESNLDDYRLVVIKHEGLDMTAQGFWPQDEERVRQEGIRRIEPHRSAGGNVKAKLEHVLRGAGLRDVDIELIPTMGAHNQIEMHIESDRRKEARQYAGSVV